MPVVVSNCSALLRTLKSSAPVGSPSPAVGCGPLAGAARSSGCSTDEISELGGLLKQFDGAAARLLHVACVAVGDGADVPDLIQHARRDPRMLAVRLSDQLDLLRRVRGRAGRVLHGTGLLSERPCRLLR